MLAAARADTVPLGWVIAIAVLAPAASLLGAWWGARREGKRRLYSEQAARNAAFFEEKRHAFSDLVAALSTMRRDRSERSVERYDTARERALGFAKARRGEIVEWVGVDPLRNDLSLDDFRDFLFDDRDLS
jgi:hypothetical protein